MARFDIKILRAFVKRKNFHNLRVNYDKTSKKRPAWIEVNGLPKNTGFIVMRINGKRERYGFWISSKYNIFLPVDSTRTELKKFYDQFSKIYDKYIIPNNTDAIKYLIKKIKMKKDAQILDLGAGTGIASGVMVKAGYKNITLTDFSSGMLAKAKKKPSLRNCRFVKADTRKLNLQKKFDLIVSVYSFAEDAYFEEDEMPKLWKRVAAHMNKGATLALIGYYYEPPNKFFKKLKAGVYLVRGEWPAKYYVGAKR